MSDTGGFHLGIASTTAARGGAEEHLLTTAEGVIAAGWRVTVFSEHVPETESLVTEYRSAGATCVPLKISRLDQLWAARGQKTSLVWAVWRAVRAFRRRPDVLLIGVQWLRLGLPLMVAAALLRIPAVVMFQLIEAPVRLTGRERRLYQWARSRGQQWVAISRNNRAMLAESTGVPEDELKVIYLGPRYVPQSRGEARKQEREAVRRELGLSLDAVVMLTVGRLHPQKGHADLINALPHLVKEFPALHSVWAGDGPLRGELERQLETRGVRDRVSLLGYRDDVERLLAAADLFLLPTHFEGGQSIALLEAMAGGVPVVASQASGIPEVVEHRKHGLLFRTGDSCDLLMTVRWALQHPEDLRLFAEEAEKRAKLFSAEVMIAETLALLDPSVRRGETDAP